MSPDEQITRQDTKRTLRWSRFSSPWLIGAVAAVLAVFIVATAVLFVWPASDPPTHVGAILSLNGGDEPSRENLAIKLAEKGYASVLLFSQGYPRTPCPRVPRTDVVCFVPVPARTAGEVEFAAEYAHRHHLGSLMIIPARPQATRARMLLERCFSGRIVTAPSSVEIVHLPYDVIYEWGALFKALFIYRHC